MTNRQIKSQTRKIIKGMARLGLNNPQCEHVMLIVFEIANGNRFRDALMKIKSR